LIIKRRILFLDNAVIVLPNLNYLADSSISKNSAGRILKVNSSNPQFQTIMNTVMNQGSITRNQTQSILGVGQTRALKILNEMVEAKLLVPIGKGKNTEYRLYES
jgi:Fic family protein